MPRSMEDLVAKQMRKSELARERRAEAHQPCVNPVITISRSMGSGGRIVARKLADNLGLSLWDRELIDAIAEESATSLKIVEAFDERTHSEIELLVYAALGHHQMSDFMYPRHLARVVAGIASVGNAVILGRGANFLLPNALNVRMDASLERRIESMINYEDIDPPAAERKLIRSDRERRRYLLRLFGRERMRSARYDICLWMDKFTADDAAEIIETAYRAAFRAPCGPG